MWLGCLTVTLPLPLVAAPSKSESNSPELARLTVSPPILTCAAGTLLLRAIGCIMVRAEGGPVTAELALATVVVITAGLEEIFAAPPPGAGLNGGGVGVELDS